MASVTFSTTIGGDGSTITDDTDPFTGLDGGGHRARFVPALEQMVAVAEHIVGTADTVNGESVAAVEAAAAAAQSAADAASVVPVGGTTGQVLAKASDTDLDTAWVDQSGGSGGGATNLTTTAAPSTVTINSSTGTDAVIPAADATNAGLILPAEKTKLAGIATGATANSADATLLARANHTGTQTAATISDFAAAADARIAASNRVQSNTTGIAGADQITNVVSLTQAEYDAATKNASTLYVIA